MSSTFGGQIDQLFYLIYYITGFTFVLVNVLLIAFLILYRAPDDGRRATYTHGNTTLEIIWTIIPALILVMLAFMSKGQWDAIKKNAAARRRAGAGDRQAVQLGDRLPGPGRQVRHRRRRTRSTTTCTCR